MYDTDYTESMSQSIRVILDNDEYLRTRLAGAITDTLRYSSGYTDMTVDDYRAVLARHEAHALVHDTVLDVVRDELIEPLPAGTSRDLLDNLLDLGCRALWEDITDAYLPTPEDYAAARGEE